MLSETLSKLNGLFEGELTDNDQLIYVNNVLKGKLLESDRLQQQAMNNTKEQLLPEATTLAQMTQQVEIETEALGVGVSEFLCARHFEPSRIT